MVGLEVRLPPLGAWTRLEKRDAIPRVHASQVDRRAPTRLAPRPLLSFDAVQAVVAVGHDAGLQRQRCGQAQPLHTASCERPPSA